MYMRQLNILIYLDAYYCRIIRRLDTDPQRVLAL